MSLWLAAASRGCGAFSSAARTLPACYSLLFPPLQMGDGTNFTVSFAGTLLSKAEELLIQGIHPSDVVAGYKKAAALLPEMLASCVSHRLENPRSVEELGAAIKPVIAAKLQGVEDILGPLIADACVSVMKPEPKAAAVVVDNVRVCKLQGGSLADSAVVRGAVVHRNTNGVIKHAEKAKVVVFSCGMEAADTETKGTVVLRTADDLKAYNKSEERAMEEKIKAVADSGAKVVVVGGSISEIAQHFLDKYNLLTVKIMSKFELRRLCKVVGATALVRVGAPMPEELGYADSVGVQEVASQKITVFRQEDDGDEKSGIATIVLRGATANFLADCERVVDDAVSVAKQLCRDARMVPGAGATEIALAAKLRDLADATPGMEQYAIRAFGESFEFLPRVLAENAGADATSAISALYAAHAGGSAAAGVNVDDGSVLDAAAAGVYDSFLVKENALRLASDAAVTVLRVDQIIMAKQAGGPKPRAPRPQDA